MLGDYPENQAVLGGFLTKRPARARCTAELAKNRVWLSQSRPQIRRIRTRQRVQQPAPFSGVALAPLDFGRFSHDLLIGQFAGAGNKQSSGYIAAYDFATGKFEGFYRTPAESPWRSIESGRSVRECKPRQQRRFRCTRSTAIFHRWADSRHCRAVRLSDRSFSRAYPRE